MRTSKAIYNSFGFSLPAVIIGAGLAGVIMLGVASQIVFGQRAARATEKTLVFNTLVDYVQRLASDPTICTASLATTQPQSNQEVALNLPGIATDPLKKDMLFQGQMKITKLRWMATPVNVPASVGYLMVEADITEPGTNEVGGQYRVFPKSTVATDGIKILLNLDATGNIINCGGTGLPAPPVWRTGTVYQACGQHYWTFSTPFPNSCKMMISNWTTTSGSVGVDFIFQQQSATPCDKFGFAGWTTNADGDSTMCGQYVNYIAIGN